MKTPRYSDTRYPHGYRSAAATDVKATFRRIRAELKAKADQDVANAAEAQVKVQPLKRGKA